MRCLAARPVAAIRKAHGTEDDKHGVNLFISHHIEELAVEYWGQDCNIAMPVAAQVLDILVQKPSMDDEEDASEMMDFTPPGGVTEYVIFVEFDEDGNVAEITMES
ncbi:MAG: DUF2004 domain-containing protein [Planctomycetota bacterium]|nr:DUF2004 domain-containing protein [Planctomycetota bacterium]